MVEVDAFRGGGWCRPIPAFFLGRQGAPVRVFSHRLSPAERNYDIGNRELLAVKLALEEWRHWLEGSGFLLSSGPIIKILSTSSPPKD